MTGPDNAAEPEPACPRCGEGFGRHICRWPNRLADLEEAENAG